MPKIWAKIWMNIQKILQFPEEQKENQEWNFWGTRGRVVFGTQICQLVIIKEICEIYVCKNIMLKDLINFLNVMITDW